MPITSRLLQVSPTAVRACDVALQGWPSGSSEHRECRAVPGGALYAGDEDPFFPLSSAFAFPPSVTSTSQFPSRDPQSPSHTLAGNTGNPRRGVENAPSLLPPGMTPFPWNLPALPDSHPEQPASELQRVPSLLLVPHSLQCPALSQGICLSTTSSLPAPRPPGLSATRTFFLPFPAPSWVPAS